mmetsp:Transcript_61220/g.162743  ORF Transcript_61220/g.162743 Transcript_61220/m.162743 type:complete len:128 (+) Transcript_61220:257-640(+)
MTARNTVVRAVQKVTVCTHSHSESPCQRNWLSYGSSPVAGPSSGMGCKMKGTHAPFLLYPVGIVWVSIVDKPGKYIGKNGNAKNAYIIRVKKKATRKCQLPHSCSNSACDGLKDSRLPPGRRCAMSV